jgi:hypothetical protein
VAPDLSLAPDAAAAPDPSLAPDAAAAPDPSLAPDASTSDAAAAPDAAAALDAAAPPTGAPDPLTSSERALYNAINDYRAEEGLPPIPLSYSLTFVARSHVRDHIENWSTVVVGDCTVASWSDQGDWTGCCYTSDHSNTGCMWLKPQELTNYTGYGFEISVVGTNEPDVALNLWRTNANHNAVMLNEEPWEGFAWQAIGVAIEGGYTHVWFGTEVDPDDFS